MTGERVDVAVIGGGIAGMSATYALGKLGVSCRLLEARPRLGGVIRTEVVDGFVLEAGPDAILTQKPEAVTLARELGLGPRMMPTNPRAKTVFVLHRGRLVPLPDGMMLGVPTRLAPMVTTRSSPGRPSENGLEVWMRPAAGRGRRVDRLLPRRGTSDPRRWSASGEPLLAGIHAGDPERLSMLAAFPRFVDMERRNGSLIRAMWKAPRAEAAGPGRSCSLQVRPRELADALAARLAGHRAHRWRARAVAPRGVGVEVEAADGARSQAGTGDRWSSAAARRGRLLPGSRSGVASALGGVPLGVHRRRVSRLSPRATSRIRSTATASLSRAPRACACRPWGSSPRSSPAAHPRATCSCAAFLGGARDPDVLDRGRRALVERAFAECAGILGLHGRALMARVFRWPRATPQMEVGHAARMASVEAPGDAQPGLFLTGSRNAPGTGMPDMVADGAAPGRARGGGFLASRHRTPPRRRPREFVRFRPREVLPSAPPSATALPQDRSNFTSGCAGSRRA